MLLAVLACLAGFVVLAKASDQFVVGSARLATILRVSPVVIGAVVVGFGTSAPEMFVSGLAAAQGDPDLGVGNIVGSNIANLSLVLGAAAIIYPLAISSKVLAREAPLSVGSCVLFALVVIGGITRVEGAILLVVLVIVLSYILRDARVSADLELVGEVREFVGDERAFGATGESIRTALGLVGTLVGAQVLVWGATTIARELDLSEGFVGLTLVAIGTSMPELVTAIQAARRREDELVVGNLLGSNIFNSLAVGGVIGLIGPGPLVDPDMTRIAVPTMLVVVGLAWAFMGRRKLITRGEGGMLLVVYAAALVLLAR